MGFAFAVDALSVWVIAFLGIALFIAFSFEFVNGFHDTANAVATVIYTRSLAPWQAVVLSGVCNVCGVFLGGTAVAFSIIHLLPVDLLVNIGSVEGLAMVMALLVGAILWNLGTWWKGLPASSSHTLIGSIIGVGLANALLNGIPYGSAVTWYNINHVLLSLLISPFLGFVLAGGCLLALRRFVRGRPDFFDPAETDHPPAKVTRGAIIASSIGVSFSHGANDGQKGVGLIMLILIGLLPNHYALNLDLTSDQLTAIAADIGRLDEMLAHKEELVNKVIEAAHAIPGGFEDGFVSPLIDIRLHPLRAEIQGLASRLAGRESLGELPLSDRWSIRTSVLGVDEALADLAGSGRLRLSVSEAHLLAERRASMRRLTEYAPSWVIGGIACALGVGTMIGWRRIVVTIGERIGCTKLSYAQGLSAQFVAAGTIALGSVLGLPVSTTHVLSSGVAGTMLANQSGLQYKTLRDIAMAWVLTFPAALVLAGILFVVFRFIAQMLF
jgi:phosphate/sulfate permease